MSVKNLNGGGDVSSSLADLLGTKGAILTLDGNNVVTSVPLNYGSGWNFLRAGADGMPQWADNQQMVVYVTGAVNRWVVLPVLPAPMPELDDSVAENHCAPSAATKQSAIPMPGLTVSTAETHDTPETATESISAPMPSISGVAALV